MKYEIENRQLSYENCYNTSIINRLPIVIRINAASFTKLTRNVQKPFCYRVSSAMAYTMFESIKKIDSAIFGYTQSGEINFILWQKNIDAEPWLNNKVQKICSRVSSMATYYFNDYMNSADEPPNIDGEVFFDSAVFGLPNATEVINNIIWRQQECMTNAVTEASLAELGRKYGRQEAYKKIHGVKTSDRLLLLKQESGIVFETQYPSNFRVGIATYKAPKIVNTSEGRITRTKWIVDINPPDIMNERMFLVNILNTGSDIFRAERDLNGSKD